MKIKYAVTFEFATRAPLTHRGIIEASQVGTCARRAIEEAQKEHAPRNWTTLNFVVLERLDVPAGDEVSEEVDAAAEA